MSTANASGHLHVSAESKTEYDAPTLASLRADAEVIIARYPQPRSALLPMLHLVQSVDGYVTGRGISLCAEMLDLSTAEVSGVATFYTQFKRHPNGEYTVGVCTNTLCAIMGGDQIWEHISEYLGIGHDETTPDGKVTLEKVECNAACDYAPVVMVNWEFYDSQTPESTRQLVDALRDGADVRPTRGPNRQCTFKEVSRVLAGFHDGLADEGVGAGEPSLLGLAIAKERGWTAPAGPTQPTPEPTPDLVSAPVGVTAPDAQPPAAVPVAAAPTPLADQLAPAQAPATQEPVTSAPATGEAHSGADTPTDGPATAPRRRVVRRRSAAAPASQPADARSDEGDAAPEPGDTPASVSEGAAVPQTLFGDAAVSAPPVADGFAQAAFGPDSAVAGPDGSGPIGWVIKGNANSMLFHAPDSPWYARTRAEVWFREEAAARSAGFADARERRRKDVSPTSGEDTA